MGSRPCRKKIGIIGGGPAGSATALHLLRKGVDPDDLLIFDRAVFPRPKLCGGAITHRGVEHLRMLGCPPHGEAVTQGLDMHSRFGSLRLYEPGPQLLYDRAWLDAHLLDLCRAANIEIREGDAVRQVEPGPSGWRIRLGNTVEPVSWVIGADGAAGITRRAAGLRGGWMGRAVEAIFETDHEEMARQWLHLNFDPLFDDIRGYAWAFPYPAEENAKLWKVGVGDIQGRTPGARLRHWLSAYASSQGFRMVGPRVSGWPEHYYTWRNVAHRRGLILVGEAHGIDSLLGEGIAPAFEMAAFAAGQLRSALDQGEDTIPLYEQKFAWTEEGRNLLFQKFLADRLYGPHRLYWLRKLFQIRRHGARGNATYGRLLRRAPALLSSVLKPRFR